MSSNLFECTTGKGGYEGTEINNIAYIKVNQNMYDR